MYIYPENLKAKPMLWLWLLRDIAIIGVAALISVLDVYKRQEFMASPSCSTMIPTPPLASTPRMTEAMFTLRGWRVAAFICVNWKTKVIS